MSLIVNTFIDVSSSNELYSMALLHSTLPRNREAYHLCKR